MTRFVVAFLAVVSLLAPAPARSNTGKLDSLVAASRDSSALRRYEAVEGLGDMGTPEAIDALIRLTADDDTAWLAVRQLVALKDAAVPRLLASLAAPDPATLTYVIYALGELKRPEAVAPILPHLANPDPEVRQNAVFALGWIGDQRAVDPLIARLSDPDNVVREYAAAALEHLGDRKAVPSLREALRREQGSVFNMATALYSLGETDVVDLLLEKLREPSGTNRLYAVYALGKLRDPREVGPLIETLTDQNVQWLSIKALINLGELAVPELAKALQRPERDIKLSAVYALGEIGDRRASAPLLETLIGPDLQVRDYAAEALVKIRDRGITPRLIYLLEKGDCSIQSQALRVLGSIGDSSTIRSIAGLALCDSPQVRMNVAFALGQLRDPDAASTLMAMLGDRVADVGEMAAQALVKIGPAAVPPLLEALPLADGRTETGIIYALGKLRTSLATEQLLRKLADTEPLVRRAAAAALSEIADPKSEEHLVMMLSDPDPVVRIYASVGLMDFGGRLSIRLLLNALRSEQTRWLAVRILDRIGPRGVDELIAALKDRNLQWYASETLVKLDGAVLPQLEEGLRSDEEVIRNNIALILGEVKDKRAVHALLEAMKDETRVVSLAASSLVSIGDPSAVEPLIECLGHQSDQVRLYAAYALGHLRDQRAADPLLGALRDADAGVRGIAAYSLGVLRARKAIPRLVDLIRDPDENVRTSAIYALGKIGDPQGTPFLREALRRDQSLRVRAAAQEALEQIAMRASP